MTHDTTQDLYARVTGKIVADLEKGEITWRKPWSDGGLSGPVSRPLRWEGTPYTGINILMLWMTAGEKGYRSPYWMTFNQALHLNAHVRKGEKAATTVYTDKIIREARWFSRAEVIELLDRLPYRPLAEPAVAYLRGEGARRHWTYDL